MNVDRRGLTLLHHAIDARTPARLRALLAKGGDARWATPAGWSLLHYAAQQDAPAEVAVLIDAGAAIDASNRNGSTPLHVAARAGRIAVVDVLLARGANVGQLDGRDVSPLGVAIAAGSLTIVDRLLAEADPVDINVNLVAVVSRGDVTAVEKLLAFGADPNFVSPRGNSPLGVAKKKRDKAIQTLLIAHGALSQAVASVRRAAVPRHQP